MKLTTHFRLVPKLRMSGAVPLLPYMPVTSWRVKGQSFVCDYRDLWFKLLFLTTHCSVS